MAGDVPPAFQFQATKEFPLPLTLELLPTVNPSASKLSTVSELLSSAAVELVNSHLGVPLTTSNTP